MKDLKQIISDAKSEEKMNDDEEQAFKRYLQKEIMEKVKSRIESEDPTIIRTIKMLIHEGEPQK